MVGVIGRSRDIDLAVNKMIVAALNLLQRIPEVRCRTTSLTISHMLSDSFRYRRALPPPLSAAMYLCFALVMKLKKSPFESTMYSTTHCLALLWFIRNRPLNGNNMGDGLQESHAASDQHNPGRPQGAIDQ